MGLSGFMQGANKKETADRFPVILGADATGTFVPMEDIQDEVFSAGILGKCCGIEPAEGKVYAPVDGKVIQLAETLHAIGIQSAEGVEVLIHVGIDTVEMNGNGFDAQIKEGDTVRKGQHLLTMDLSKIKEAGYPATVITVVTNSNDFSSVEVTADGLVEPETDMICIRQ